MVPYPQTTLIGEALAWCTKGVHVDPGVCLCLVVGVAIAWFATARTGEAEYPQERGR